MTTKIDVTVFDTPSGNVRGMVYASMDIRGKARRVAHATLLVGKEADITIEVPRKLSCGDVESLAGLLAEFSTKVGLLA